MQSPPVPRYLVPPRPKYSPQHLILNNLSLLSSRNVSDQVSQPYKTTGRIIVLYMLNMVYTLRFFFPLQNAVYTLRFFSSSKCSLLHNSNVFCSYIIHILYTLCAKIKKKIRRQKVKGKLVLCMFRRHVVGAQTYKSTCYKSRHLVLRKWSNSRPSPFTQGTLYTR